MSDAAEPNIDSESIRNDLVNFALSEAIRTLDHQEAELGRMRDRSVTQLAFTATVATFVFGSVLSDPRPDTFDLRFAGAIVTGEALIAMWLTYIVIRVVPGPAPTARKVSPIRPGALASAAVRQVRRLMGDSVATHRGWYAKVSAEVLVQYAEYGDPPRALKELVGFYGKARDQNEEILKPRRRALFAATLVEGVILITAMASLWGLH